MRPVFATSPLLNHESTPRMTIWQIDSGPAIVFDYFAFASGYISAAKRAGGFARRAGRGAVESGKSEAAGTAYGKGQNPGRNGA